MKRTALAATVAAAVLFLPLTSAPAQASVPTSEYGYGVCWANYPMDTGPGSTGPNILQWWNPHCWYAWLTNKGYPGKSHP
jgi:hypothetical protein